jgi:uncharacterized protein
VKPFPALGVCMENAAAIPSLAASSLAVESAAVAAPVAERERIVSIDVLRGFALLGILAMNIQDFSMPGAAYLNPHAYGDLHGLNYLVWYASRVLADQKMMSIFSMLFGAGVFLMTSRLEAAGKNARALHYRRMGWLILFGLLHGFMLWSGDILYDYGMCGLLIFLFRKKSPRTLLIVGTLFFSVFSVIFTGADRGLRKAPAAEQKQSLEEIWRPTQQQTEDELAGYRGNWLAQSKFRAPETVKMKTVYFVGLSFWREMGLMLIGIAFFKLGIFSAQAPASWYKAMLAVALLIGVPLTIYGSQRMFFSDWQFPDSFFLGMQYNYWASVLIAFGWIGALMLITQNGLLTGLRRRLAAVGRMAFSNYILDTVICTTIFYGHGFGLFGKVERVWQFVIALAIWAFQLIVSPIWLRHFQFGPLEWLWRSLTYLQWEPFRRRAAAGLAS